VALWQFDLDPTERLRATGVPLWQDYRYQAVALLALTAVVVIAFR
jgi:hypothetical protein